MSKEQELLQITVIPVIPIPLWLRLKEPQKGNYKPIQTGCDWRKPKK